MRVSTLDQNEQPQLEGLALDRIFTDKAPGRGIARPQLVELVRFACDGDSNSRARPGGLLGNGNGMRRLRRTSAALTQPEKTLVPREPQNPGQSRRRRHAQVCSRLRLRDQSGNGIRTRGGPR